MPQYPVIDKVKTGKQLKQLIKNKGYTIKDIQQYLSLSCIQTIYRWFDGINIPSVDNLYALSALLQVPIDRLIIGNKEEDNRYTLMKCLNNRQKRIWTYFLYMNENAVSWILNSMTLPSISNIIKLFLRKYWWRESWEYL